LPEFTLNPVRTVVLKALDKLPQARIADRPWPVQFCRSGREGIHFGGLADLPGRRIAHPGSPVRQVL
jgi:hypothetical protein